MARPAAPPYGRRPLELGLSNSLDVWHLQIKLIGWGSGSLDGVALKDEDRIGIPMDPVVVTGTYDSTTADAVRRFQKAHGLAVTGVCDAATFRAIDREQADHPVFFDTLKCPCAAGKNANPTLCRCNQHPTATVACTGFGGGHFAGAFTHTDNLDLYDKYEHPGIDKAVVWAVRALMHRAAVSDITVVGGYRCWFDNYHTTDDTRWKHRTSTFHLGKTIEIRHRGVCIETGANPCPECDRMRKVALGKCGFQLRFHQASRVSVAEGGMDARPPASPFAVHINTVRRKDKENDDFVKTDDDALKPLYEGKAGFCMPLDLGAGTDPKRASAADFFDNIETSEGGGFPLGANRLWHTGVHVHAAKGKDVFAITDGEVVGCRVGEGEQAKTFGSRNFVLLRHKRKDKAYYSLYMHVDGETAKANATVRWRRELFVRTKDHVVATFPSPVYKHVPAVVAPPAPSKLVPQGHATGLTPGEAVAVTGGAVDPKNALDPSLPDNCEVYKLAAPAADGKDQYIFTKRSNVDVATKCAPVGGLANKIAGGHVIGLRDPIVVTGGEKIGRVADPPSDAELRFAGSFVHIEAFSEDNLLTAPDFADYTLIDATDPSKVLVRAEVSKTLVDAPLKLVDPVVDDVLAESDAIDLVDDPNIGRFRSVVLKTRSAWALDYKDLLSKSVTFSFMDGNARDALGDRLNEYRFWTDVDAADAGKLVPPSVVHHYHPLALVLAFAYKPET